MCYNIAKGGMNMNLSIIDYIVIGVILISAIIGIKKGFVKVLFSLIRKFASFFIAIFLVKPVRSFLRTTVVNEKIYGFFLNWVSGKGEQFNQPVPEGGMSDALKESLKLPKFLCDLLSKVIGDGSATEGMTLGEVFSETLTYYVLTIIAFILLLIVASIVIALLSKIFVSIFESEQLKGINRFLGFILGIAIGVATIWIAFIIVDFAGTIIPWIQEKVVGMVDPENQEFGIARWLYNNNFMSTLVQNLLNSTDVLAKKEVEEPAAECVMLWRNFIFR